MKENIFKDYINQYSLSKTLKFELIPQGETENYIKSHGILSEDNKRAKDYKMVKKMIDSYHKNFMERSLKSLVFEGIDDYYVLYNTASKNDKELKDIEAKMRKQVVCCFKQDEEMNSILKAGLMVKHMTQNAKTDEEKKALDSFQKFSTYFDNFMNNRKNMYSDEEKSTAVAYRIVNQNLPRFIDNMKAFEWIMESELCEKIIQLERDIADILGGKKIETFFRVENYEKTVTNYDISLYNTLIGGIKLENGRQIIGINGYVNEFNQKNSKNKSVRKMPKLKPLYKQILSDRETLSFVEEQFDEDQTVLDTVKEIVEDIYEQVVKYDAEYSLERLFANIAQYDMEKIYIKNGPAITDLSNAVYGDWSVIKHCIEQEYDETVGKKTKVKNDKYYDKRNAELKKQGSYSISKLNELVQKYSTVQFGVENYYLSLAEKDGSNLLKKFEDAYKKAEELLYIDYSSKHGLAGDKKNVILLKQLLDSAKAIEEFVKSLLGTGGESDKDVVFYGELDVIYQKLSQIIPLYNKVRNYVTRKPYSTEKIKLNFQNPTLLKGWDINKERDNLAMIFRKDNLYYLGIMDKKYNKSFSEKLPQIDGDYYEKMEYKLLPGPNKMLPKVFFAKSNLDMFKPSKEILSNYQNGTHTVGERFNIDDCHKLIDFFKDSIDKHEDWSKFGFTFTETDKYKDISQFYHEVERQGYSIKFKRISSNYIDELVESGKLYLFQIYNKDFSPYSKGTPNLHTLYWRMLFDERNLQDVVFKLNGEAEVFYRKASIEKENIVVHAAKENIAKKDLIAKENGETSVFEYDLIKDKRYTVDKFQFHVPITINFCAEGRGNLNEKVKETICLNDDVNVIGIDRGERNLLYISVVSPDGKILYQSSLNEIISKCPGKKDRKVDYHKLLQQREDEMDYARKNWMEINSIKELKEGYISQVIHVITDLMIRYNAIVVLEDLNFGFINGRKKVGKQVYQKFEKMLIDKLNFLVDKKIQENENGGALKGYQLTNQFESFKKLGKQSGFLFYIPAWNTSKIDPTTGFVNLLYPKYTNEEDAKVFIRKFDSIVYNKEEGYFEFQFDYRNFTDKEVGKQSKWTICSYGDRLKIFRNPNKNNEWDSETVKLTERIKKHMSEQNIEIENGNLIDDICNINNASFFKNLIEDIKLVLQIRNSKPNSAEDYMLSPVKNATGDFFDTRKYNEKDECFNYFPKDADANGAYNIARKGLWAMEKIRKEGNGAKLAISNKEWLEYAQEHVLK